ncbi:ASF1 anti-silencing function 1 [Gurleya vavrai]
MITLNKITPPKKQNLILPLNFSVILDNHNLLSEVEFKIIYTGSPDTNNHDQIICHEYIGPVPIGRVSFDLLTNIIDINEIPVKNLFGVTSVVIIGKYNDKEFLRIGYFVKIEYEDIETEKLTFDEEFNESEEEIEDSESEEGDDEYEAEDSEEIIEEGKENVEGEEENEMEEFEEGKKSAEGEEENEEAETEEYEEDEIDDEALEKSMEIETGVKAEKHDSELSVEAKESTEEAEKKKLLQNKNIDETLNDGKKDIFKMNIVQENIRKGNQEEIMEEGIENECIDEENNPIETTCNIKNNEFISLLNIEKLKNIQEKFSENLSEESREIYDKSNTFVPEEFDKKEVEEINNLIQEEGEGFLRVKEYLIDTKKIYIEFCEPPLITNFNIDWIDEMENGKDDESFEGKENCDDDKEVKKMKI